MPKPNALGLSLYTDLRAHRAAVVALVAEANRGAITGKLRIDVDAVNGRYYIGENDEYSRSQLRPGGPDAFLYSKYIIDVEPTSADVHRTAYVSEVRSVASRLQEAGATVVAVGDCDEEINEGPGR